MPENSSEMVLKVVQLKKRPYLSTQILGFSENGLKYAEKIL